MSCKNDVKHMQTATENTPKLPNIITKAELRNALRCTSNDQWTKKVFPEKVILEVLGLDVASFKRIRQFDVMQTKSICTYFNLTAKDFTQ
jgi:hypothetical protein